MTNDEHSPARLPDATEWIDECAALISTAGHRIAYRRQGQGPTVLMLHGFPTWSYDYVDLATDLAHDHDVVTFDFLGYGASDKPSSYVYSVAESADIVEQLVAHLDLGAVDLVIHDYGSIVGQELLDRLAAGRLGFDIKTVTVFNCGLVYSAYRPTLLQKLLVKPVVGTFLASRVSRSKMRSGLDKVRGTAKLSDAEFESLWIGISRNDGQKIAHLLLSYNAERAAHHKRWESALGSWEGPLHLIWGMADPVSGRHVLVEARKVLPHARVTELEGVGHFPMAEAPAKSIAAVRQLI
jgi:pimeloyl-ACP methyl ester carboxylesterase